MNAEGDGAGIIELSYFGRLKKLYDNPPASRRQGLKEHEVGQNSAAAYDKAHLGLLITQRRITIESMNYLYSMTAGLAFAMLNESLKDGRITSSEESMKNVMFTLMNILIQRQRIELSVKGLAGGEQMDMLNMVFVLMETDEEFIQRVIEGAYNDAFLKLLQVGTSQRAGEMMQIDGR